VEIGLSACAAAGFTPDVAHHVDDHGAFLQLVAAGCGVGLVPSLAVSGDVPDGVVLRPPAEPHRPCRHVYAAIRAGAERSPVIGPVVAALVAVARRRSAGPR
jgi:DNA-binding transcriptional LysR family regulator